MCSTFNLKRAKNSYGGYSMDFFSRDRQKFKKYFNLKRSWNEPKLCALKKIKFDDIISIKNIIENIPEYTKEKLNQN
jgi:hypothetical protein